MDGCGLRGTAACIALACAAASAQAQAQPQGDAWRFAITPYLWLPNINGTLAFDVPSGGGGSPEVGVGPHDWLESLSGMLMISGEARKGRWSILGDFIYLDFSNEHGRVKSVNFGAGRGGRIPVAASANLDTESDLTGRLFSLAGAYRVMEEPRGWVDVFGGMRYFGIKTSVDWSLASNVSVGGAGGSFARSGHASEDRDLWDGIVGVRGEARLGGSRWFVPASLDLGAGSSDFTWQASLGLAYRFGWGDLLLTYRHLEYDTDGKLLNNFRFSGPAFGATFRF